MSPSARYSIVEPHPSVVPSKSYIHAGRGGAGNVTKVPSTVTLGPSATGPAARASQASLSKPRHSYSTTGRGGAGNVQPSSERAIFSFDEELERQMIQEDNIAPVFHIGRGGAGNLRHSSNKTSSFAATRRDSESSSGSNRSNSSAESGADIATRRMKQAFKKISF